MFIDIWVIVLNVKKKVLSHQNFKLFQCGNLITNLSRSFDAFKSLNSHTFKES